jgi:hypothetical protein
MWGAECAILQVFDLNQIRRVLLGHNAPQFFRAACAAQKTIGCRQRAGWFSSGSIFVFSVGVGVRSRLFRVAHPFFVRAQRRVAAYMRLRPETTCRIVWIS